MTERDDVTEAIVETASWTGYVLGESDDLRASMARLSELLRSPKFDAAVSDVRDALDVLHEAIKGASHD